MSMKEQILSIAMQDPRFEETITIVEEQLSGANIVAEDLTEAIKMLEYVVQSPDTYPEVRMAAIQDGLIDENMFPPQYDEVVIISLLVVLYGMQDRLAQQGYARGGLKTAGKQLAHQGQGGDRHLAHINAREAEVLRRMGGQGTVNPNTGLREYKGLKNILKIALPIALSFIAPVLIPYVGTAVLGTGASALAQGIVGGALVGAGGSALQGVVSGEGLDAKRIGLGALAGGIGGAAPGITESLASQFPNLSEGALRALAGTATGAGSAFVTGSDPVEGGIKGAITQYAAPTVKDMTLRASDALFSPELTTASGAPVGDTMKPILSGGAPDFVTAMPSFDSARVGNVDRLMDDRSFISSNEIITPLLSDGQIVASNNSATGSELDLGTTMMNPEFQQSVVENLASGADFATEVSGQNFLKTLSLILAATLIRITPMQI